MTNEELEILKAILEEIRALRAELNKSLKSIEDTIITVSP